MDDHTSLCQVFPPEILDLRLLVSLKLRNNPIKEIPHGKRTCSSLHSLSMCLHFHPSPILRSGLRLRRLPLPSTPSLPPSQNFNHFYGYFCICFTGISCLKYLKVLDMSFSLVTSIPSWYVSVIVREA